jgi:hypothetical protein
MGDAEDRLLAALPLVTFRCAIEAFPSDRLEQSWLRSLPRHGAAILSTSWLEVLRSTADLAAGLWLLGYPRNLNKTAEELSRRINALRDDAQGDKRLNLQASLLRAALDDFSAASWQIIATVLPELRVAVIQGKLPNVAERMLTDDLPRFRYIVYWDLDKRILLSMSKLYKSFPNPAVLHELHLSDLDVQLVVSGEDEEKRNSFTRLWDWL